MSLVLASARGKLIQYHGWNDGSPPPFHSVNYYISVLAKMGGVEKTQNLCRLFMAPGMVHCGGGPGPNMFGNMLALVPAWDPQHNILPRWKIGLKKARRQSASAPPDTTKTIPQKAWP